MLAIRLSRTGSSKRPSFRVVVAESKQARDSRFVEIIGHYKPRSAPAEVIVDRERLAYWLKAGARPSDTVRTLIARHLTNPPEATVVAAAAEAPQAAPGEAQRQAAPAEGERGQ
ncbi:MAG: 30S ribosomal protein S16 [Acidobacteria bacterium]|nr:MAG: 30S ribosomal protein S16 [Acidobacteriota bacterium]